MGRILFPASFAIAALAITGFGGDLAANQASPPPAVDPVRAQTPPAVSAAEEQGDRDKAQHRTADLQQQVSGLQGLVDQVRQQVAQRKARPPAGDRPEQQSTDSQQQDRELHSELQGLIPQLEQELELEAQRPPASDAAEQKERQAARDEFRLAIADLRREDIELQELLNGHEQTLAQTEVRVVPAVTNLSQQILARDEHEHEVGEIRSQIDNLQRQNDALKRQLVQQQRELAQRSQELAERTHDLDAARAEAEKLRRQITTLNRQRQAEHAAQTRQKTQAPQTAIAAWSRPAEQQPIVRPTEPISDQQLPQPPPTAQPTPPALTPEPMRQMPSSPSATGLLKTAWWWLSMGRPEEARRVLVQTEIVFPPVTSDPPVPSRNAMAIAVRDAIRWLDMGVVDQAMRAIAQALEFARREGGPVRAWSGYRAGPETGQLLADHRLE